MMGPARVVVGDGVQALAFAAGALDFTVLIDRSLDIGPLSWRGIKVGWESPTGNEGHGETRMDGIDEAVLKSVADQLMSVGTVMLPDQKVRVGKTSRQRLRTARFQMNGREYEAIEQNPEKPSRWGKLAAAGHRVVQFRDVLSNKYVGVAVDGEVRTYGRK